MNERARTRSQTSKESADGKAKSTSDSEFQNFKPEYESSKINNPFSPRLSLSRSPPRNTLIEKQTFAFEIREGPKDKSKETEISSQLTIVNPNTPTLTQNTQKDTHISPQNTPIQLPLQNTQNTQIKNPSYSQTQTSNHPANTIKSTKDSTRNMANTTLENALKEVKAPATPKFITPPSFNPSVDLPVTFLAKYERTAISNGWTDAFKISYLGNFLDSPASYWFNDYIINANNKANTWDQIKKDFVKEFSGEQPLRKLKFKLTSRKQQANEDIKTYYYDILTLSREIDENMPFETFREYFENGLNPSFYETYYLMCDSNMTYNSLKTLVFKLSEVRERALLKQITSQTSLLAISDDNQRDQHERGKPGTQRHNQQGKRGKNQNYYRRDNAQRNLSKGNGFYGGEHKKTYRDTNRNYGQNYNQNYKRHYGRNYSQNYNRSSRGGHGNGPAREWQRQRARNDLPNTRHSDGRPRCYDCNKIGHYSCGNQNQERSLVLRGQTPPPNASGRLN